MITLCLLFIILHAANVREKELPFRQFASKATNIKLNT